MLLLFLPPKKATQINAERNYFSHAKFMHLFQLIISNYVQIELLISNGHSALEIKIHLHPEKNTFLDYFFFKFSIKIIKTNQNKLIIDINCRSVMFLYLNICKHKHKHTYTYTSLHIICTFATVATNATRSALETAPTIIV